MSSCINNVKPFGSSHFSYEISKGSALGLFNKTDSFLSSANEEKEKEKTKTTKSRFLNIYMIIIITIYHAKISYLNNNIKFY